MKNYILNLQNAIKSMHGCGSIHLETSQVKSVHGEKIAWEGEVETFELQSHPVARRCYAWGYEENGRLEVTSVLATPAINSPSKAVDVAIVAKAKPNRE